MKTDAGARMFPEPMLIGTVLCLIGLGAIMSGSASIGIADENVGRPLYFFFQHLGALAVGGAGMLFATRVPIAAWNRVAGALMLLAIVLGNVIFFMTGGRRKL